MRQWEKGRRRDREGEREKKGKSLYWIPNEMLVWRELADKNWRIENWQVECVCVYVCAHTRRDTRQRQKWQNGKREGGIRGRLRIYTFANINFEHFIVDRNNKENSFRPLRYASHACASSHISPTPPSFGFGSHTHRTLNTWRKCLQLRYSHFYDCVLFGF